MSIQIYPILQRLGQVSEPDKAREDYKKRSLVIKIALFVASLAIAIIFAYKGLVGTKEYNDFANQVFISSCSFYTQ